MLLVTGNITVDPSDHDRFVELTVPAVAATLAEEGNLGYGFWADPSTPGNFCVVEEWQDQAALDMHMVSPHLIGFITAMADLKVTGTEIHVHEVSNSTRLM